MIHTYICKNILITFFKKKHTACTNIEIRSNHFCLWPSFPIQTHPWCIWSLSNNHRCTHHECLIPEWKRRVETIFRQNDVFILDRGFRDAVPFLENLGYKIFKQKTLEAGEIQLPTIKANKSRCVTLCRWVVEVVNGRLRF